MLYWWLTVGIGILLAMGWLATLRDALWFFRSQWLTKLVGKAPNLDAWPAVTIVVPARDEEAKIGDTLSSLAALDYPSLQIIAVNDRSSDRTGEIMAEFVSRDPRFTALDVETLPDGWLGKNHAMHVASQHAAGEYILFTDGDVTFRPDVLTLAIRWMRHKNLDHLIVLAEFRTHGYWERLFVGLFGLMYVMANNPRKVPTENPRAYVGSGSFNLVRREPYEEMGGYEALRMEVIDDLNLGRAMKQSGAKQQVLMGPDLVSVRWQEGLGGCIRGLEKNGFAGMKYSLSFLALMTLLMLAVFYLPYVGLILFQDVRVVPYAIAAVIIHSLVFFLPFVDRNRILTSLGIPAAVVLYLIAFWRSAYVVLKQGGIRWRETFYSLDELRAHKKF